MSPETTRGMILPRWFLLLISGVFLVSSVSFIPWAVWVTKTLMVIDVRSEMLAATTARMDTITNSVGSLSERMARMEGSLQRHEKASEKE